MTKGISFQRILLTIAMLSFTISALADSSTVTINSSTVQGIVNEKLWGVGAPDKYSWWVGNENLIKRISDARIKIIRVSPVQLGNNNNHDVYPTPNNWNWTDMDAILNTIWESGAQPLFLVCGFPGGVNTNDWNAYATFMEGVVDRYNIQKALGETKTIKYWEMWNEPTVEGDGTLTKEEYKTFVEVVGSKMKETDSSIKLIGPADAWANLNSDGYVAYTAKYLADYIDILCWHDYGPSPDNNDAGRMDWTRKHYQTNIASAQKSFGTFATAITEYNISHADGGADYNAKYHNEFAATYMASAIINAMKGKAEVFCAYNLAETGSNLLGILNNADYSPYKPYYSFYLLGNYTGQKLIESTTEHTNLECITSIDTITNQYFITILNKSTNQTSYDIHFKISDISSTSGNIIVRILDAENNPTSIADAFSYSNSEFRYTIPSLGVVNFEVFPTMKTDVGDLKTDQLLCKLFPNPVRGNSISLIYSESENNELLIYNLLGESVYSQRLKNTGNKTGKQNINISMLPKGTYIVKLKNSKNSTSQIFIRD